MGRIISISFTLNFTPNTLGYYRLILNLPQHLLHTLQKNHNLVGAHIHMIKSRYLHTQKKLH